MASRQRNNLPSAAQPKRIRKRITSKDNDDINSICDPYERMHKDIANNVYGDELKRVKKLSERERDPSIFRQYKKTKYAAVCRMAEAMRAYIRMTKTYTEGLEKYMKNENI